MQMTFRPVQWDGPYTALLSRKGAYNFKATWASTLDLLDRELFNLQAQNVVLQAGFQESDIRLDGMVRSNARIPAFPGVRLLFDSRHGPLVYQTDVYDSWKANVRAIALSLEALRKVDRYGVTKAAEQYKGWKAIEGGVSPVQARQTLADVVGVSTPAGGFNDQSLYRAAAKISHPDQGGSRETWDAVQTAKEVLGL